jgi:hypothetical protein
MAISKRAAERAMSGLKRLLPIMQQQKTRDVSEADTVTLVKDVMADVFGFDKYSEVTSEHAIRGTYCDLAVTIEEKLIELIEIKSAGTALDDRHVKQAIDYAANEGVVWVVLTNGSVWWLYQVLFAKPIDKRLLIEVDLTTLDLRRDDCIDCLAPFMREGFAKGVQEELRDRQDATSRYLLSALILNNENVIGVIRRELRRVVDVLEGIASVYSRSLYHSRFLNRIPDISSNPHAFREGYSRNIPTASKSSSAIPGTKTTKPPTQK